VAAFLAGRLFNRLRFYAEQAWFLDGDALDRAARVASRLDALAGRPATSAGHADPAYPVSTWFWRIRRWIDSGAHELELQDRLTALHDPGLTAAELRQLVWDEASPLDGLRLFLWVALPGSARAAFELGEAIDQGLCPEDVGGAGTDLLVNPCLRPGDLPPEAGWQEFVRDRWQKAGLAAPCPRPPLSRLQDVAGRKRCLRRVRRQAERQLAAAPPPASRPPRLSDRIRVEDPSSMAIWLDGRTVTFDHPVGFRVMQLLIDAGDQGVARETFESDPVCMGAKIDRVIRNHLRPVFGDIFKSKPGNGGRRWLRLPPLCP
jgi:hypothetical protein